MKKWQLILILVLIVSLLTACECKHTFGDATCEEPATCSKCGETEGEALGHTWVDADCETPKTCSVCGQTEGSALGHTWVDANFQTPKTCSACGKTDGDVLQAAFEVHGLSASCTENVPYDYVTVCYDDAGKKTTGKATFHDYRVFDFDDTHEALDGYEWRCVKVTIVFSDENARKYGYSCGACQENYYDIQGWDNSSRHVDDYTSEYTANFNGQDYDACQIYSKWENSGWVDNVVTIEVTLDARVPAGFDGVVFGLRDNSTAWEDGMYIYDVADENTLLFRLG